MSLSIGRIVIDDPEAWPEPVGQQTTRVGGTPTPGTRTGTTISPRLTLAPPDSSTRDDRMRIRRQVRSLAANSPACLQAQWVSWTEDPEQDGWYVPAAGTIDMQSASLMVGHFTISALGLDLVGRPRSHRRAVLVRSRDLRLATEPKDTLRRVYGRAFDGSGGVGSAVTPAPRVWLPSGAADVVVSSGGTPSIGETRVGRGGASLTEISGASDLALAHFEQPAAHRHRGDAVILDRRADTATSWSATGPEVAWEEVYGADWPWAGRVVLDNDLTRVVEDDAGVLVWESWTGAAYERTADLVAIHGSTILDTVLSRTVHEWAPDRAVLRLVMHAAATPGTRCEVLVSLQRGWAGPMIEVYASDAASAGIGVEIPGSGFFEFTVPAAFTAAVNYGRIISSGGVGVALAVTQPTATTATVSQQLQVTAPGVVRLRVEQCAGTYVATLAPILGADTLTDVRYPQTIVPR